MAVICDRDFPAQQWQMVGRVELNQWVHDGTAVIPAVDTDIAALGAADADAMFALAKLADPGPFERETWRLGAYYGIRADALLIAMAGERMRLTGFAEVSAVATRPGYEGRSYATRLVRTVMAREVAKGEQPFLHVRRGSPAEQAAARVYEKLGFRVRCRLAFQAARRR
ncbi:MAG: GNAT family N-acetyltransferase [Gammaproteobacteria bacterium]|nr:GNAT family N-acetyltransferase [Gammaproteobacteria bacterium]